MAHRLSVIRRCQTHRPAYVEEVTGSNFRYRSEVLKSEAKLPLGSAYNNWLSKGVVRDWHSRSKANKCQGPTVNNEHLNESKQKSLQKGPSRVPTESERPERRRGHSSWTVPGRTPEEWIILALERRKAAMHSPSTVCGNVQRGGGGGGTKPCAKSGSLPRLSEIRWFRRRPLLQPPSGGRFPPPCYPLAKKMCREIKKRKSPTLSNGLIYRLRLPFRVQSQDGGLTTHTEDKKNYY